MTYLKNALDRARPQNDIFDTRADKSGAVLLAVLALIFAPIILAHVVSLSDAEARPTAIEGTNR